MHQIKMQNSDSYFNNTLSSLNLIFVTVDITTTPSDINVFFHPIAASDVGGADKGV